jgi:iron complex outermembrane recepter protein
VLPVIRCGRDRGRISALRSLLISTSTFTAVALLAVNPGASQTAARQGAQAATDQGRLPQIRVAGQRPKRHGRPRQSGAQAAAPAAPAPPTAGPAQPAGGAAGTASPLNTGAVATSATRLGLTVRETPATVEVLDQSTMREQGYRTTTETAQGAVGVLSGDAAGAPAGFSMRGFTYGEVNVLYNGISTGPQSITSRWMDTANLQQVEFLKGPSALMSGLDAIGGSVNYVTRQPTTGPIQNELDLSLDSLGSVRTHFGSGGSTAVPGLDYRVDLTDRGLTASLTATSAI